MYGSFYEWETRKRQDELLRLKKREGLRLLGRWRLRLPSLRAVARRAGRP